MNELLDLGLSGKSSEKNTDRIGRYVEEFYEQNSFEQEEEGEYFMAGFDSKGVPK